MKAIDIKDVCKSYGSFHMENVTFPLPSGCILGLVGENGAGKSTLIRLITGAAVPDSGEICVLGIKTSDKGFEDVKQEIGVVLDEPVFPEMLTVGQIGDIMAGTYKNHDEKLYSDLIKRFSIDENGRFSKLSRGMKAKVAFAAALAHKPKILILDEAASALDPMARDELMGLLSDFTRDEENSVLISSHIVSDLEKVCDYIAFIHKGKLLLYGEKDRILEDYGIVKTTKDDLKAIPKEAVVSASVSKYGAEALVKKVMAPRTFVYENAALEDIIIFLARGDDK